MFDRLRRRRHVLTAAELMQSLNQVLRRASRSWIGPQRAGKYGRLDGPADFQQPLAAAYRAHTEVLADVLDLAAASRTHLSDTVPSLKARESIEWAAYLLGQAEAALRQAALDTCPDANLLAPRRT
ncbi:hypothetical protein ACIQF6_28465 [Kitasatospora sp. NPDC092948]|uniref:hypothetical protein n=1 Tax=Kitasatospora sp. NPDC092948 TaxID=3364088 RepID=UPI00380662FF